MKAKLTRRTRRRVMRAYVETLHRTPRIVSKRESIGGTALAIFVIAAVGVVFGLLTM